MSRRYGRNQKRRAREELAAAELEKRQLNARLHGQNGLIQSLHHGLREVKKKCDAFEAAVKGIEDALGPNSVVLAPAKRTMQSHYLGSFALADDVLGNWHPGCYVGETAPLETIRVRMYSAIEGVIKPDHWSRKQHFMVKFEDRPQTVYAVEPDVLVYRDAHKLLERELVPMLVAHFLNAMAKGNGR